MKNIINNKLTRAVLVLWVLLFTISCSDEFLNEPEATDGITEEVVFSNRTIVESYVTGILARFKGQHSNVDTGGLYSMYFARTVKGNDLIQGASWYRFDYGHENREPTFRRVVFNWDYNYEMINYANVLISGLEKSNLDQGTKNEYIAVGKTLRAFHYFQLALEFAPNYNNDRSLARLPIYTSPAAGDSTGNPPSPLSEVYNLILNDLKEAIPNLTDNRLGKSFINKAVANGILARVLLVTQDDWSLAASAAKEAYGSNPNTAVVSSSWGNGFNSIDDQDWLWGMFQDGTSESNFFFAAPHVFTDHLVLSYQATYVNKNFVDTFSATDVRKLFFNIYNSSIPYREFITTKFAFTFAADMPIMRKSEMVLIDAEAQYNLGNEQAARDLLFALQSARDSNAVKTNATGNALLEEILLERRKELYGEHGVEWFDNKRLQRPINRDNVHRVLINVPTNSELYYLKIPQKEIDANPNIDDSINN